jgi:hypothetical protein
LDETLQKTTSFRPPQASPKSSNCLLSLPSGANPDQGRTGYSLLLDQMIKQKIDCSDRKYYFRMGASAAE